MNKLKIEYVDIDTIKPNENNVKLHPEEQIEQIKLSIQRNEFNDPIGVKNNVIIEGHGRWIACKELGIKEVPIIRLDHLTDEQALEYMLTHNQLTMNSGNDTEKLEFVLEKDFIVFDEFTSVVDRQIAQTSCIAINKAIKKTNKKFIAVSCHRDIIEWLQPDWIFDTDIMQTVFQLSHDHKNNSQLKSVEVESGKSLGNITI